MKILNYKNNILGTTIAVIGFLTLTFFCILVPPPKYNIDPTFAIFMVFSGILTCFVGLFLRPYEKKEKKQENNIEKTEQ